MQVEQVCEAAGGAAGANPTHRGPALPPARLRHFLSFAPCLPAANDVKWRKPVMPGDILFIETELLKTRRNIAQARGRCIVNGQVVSEADLMFTLVDR